MTNVGRDPYGPRNRWLMLGSSLCVVLACSVAAVFVGGGWWWGLFVWGVALGGVAIVGYEAIFRVTAAATDAPAAEVARVKTQLKPRKKAVYPVFGAYGLGMGIASGGMRSIWPDVAFTGIVILREVVVPLPLYPLIRRRAEQIRQRSGGAEGAEAR